MKRNEKFKNFSKLLYSINLHKKRNLRKCKTIEKKVKKNSTQNSSFNLLEPEIEYVSKLNFYNPESSEENNLFQTIKTTPNFNKLSLKFRHKKTFNIDEEKLQNNGEKFENKEKEYKLENKRKDLEVKINKIKGLIKPLNEELSKVISEIDNLKLDFEVLQNNKTNSLIEKNFKKKVIANELITNSISKKNSTTINSLPALSSKSINSERTKEQKMKIDTIVYIHKEEMRTKKNFAILKINKLNEKKNEIMEKIKACENDLKNFKEERNKVKKELLIHYHNVLLKGKDTRKQGLSWIINAIWNLKSNVLLSYLPKFLDNESISFLFSYSLKKMKIKSMYKIIQELSIKIKEKEFENNNKENNQNKNNTFKEKTIDEDSNTQETILFDYNGFNSSKETLKLEEEKKDNNSNYINNYNIKKNKEWLKGIAKTNSFISKEDKKINLFNRPKEILLDLSQKNNKIKYFNIFNEYHDTFRTRLYNNINKTSNQLRKREKSDKEEEKKKYLYEFLENEENSIKHCLFNKKMLTQPQAMKKNTIKLTDFENLYNNENKKKEINEELFELYNKRKEIENNYIKLKNDIQNMIKNELDRLFKCFYKEDYAAKYNVDQNTVISAIIGEENARNELSKQIKEGQKYLKTLKGLRNWKISI